MSICITHQSYQARKDECRDGGAMQTVHYVVKDYLFSLELRLALPNLDFRAASLILRLVLDDGERSLVPSLQKEAPLSFHVILDAADRHRVRAECKVSALSSQWKKLNFLVAAHAAHPDSLQPLTDTIYSEPIFVVSKVSQLPGYISADRRGRKRARADSPPLEEDAGMNPNPSANPSANPNPSSHGAVLCMQELIARQDRMLLLLQRHLGLHDDITDAEIFASRNISLKSSAMQKWDDPDMTDEVTADENVKNVHKMSGGSGGSVSDALRELVAALRGVAESDRREALRDACREVREDMGDIGDVLSLIDSVRSPAAEEMMLTGGMEDPYKDLFSFGAKFDWAEM